MAVSLTHKTLELFGQTSPIRRFEVWFQTPFGLIASLDDAVKRCVADDMDPDRVIAPVSVAVGDDNLYEVIGH